MKFMKFSCSNIGEVLGSGQHSVVIRPIDEYNISSIDNAVLYITDEEEKFSFLNSVFQGTDIQIEKIDKSKATADFLFYLDLLEEQGFHFFYVTEMESLDVEEGILSNYLYSILEKVYGLMNEHFFIYKEAKTFPWEEFYSELLFPFIEENATINNFSAKILKAIRKALKAITFVDTNKSIALDMHPEQFCVYKDKIYCVDAFVFV